MSAEEALKLVESRTRVFVQPGAAEPEVLLLDEPLSALDLKLRQHMRTELRAIQQRVGITFIVVGLMSVGFMAFSGIQL